MSPDTVSVSSAGGLPPSTSVPRDTPLRSSTFRHFSSNELDRFFAAVHTIENFVVSCTASGFGISVNRKYIGQLVDMYLRYGTSAVEQLTANIERHSAAESGLMTASCCDVVEESKQLLLDVVEHAATLHEYVKRESSSAQVSVLSSQFKHSTLNMNGKLISQSVGMNL